MDRRDDVDRDRQARLVSEVGSGAVPGHRWENQHSTLLGVHVDDLGIDQRGLLDDTILDHVIVEQVGRKLIGRRIVEECNAARLRRLLKVVDQADVRLEMTVRCDALPAL